MVYAAATVVYSGSWMYYIRKARQAALGVDFDRSEVTETTRITKVYPNSSAQRAGVQEGDGILAISPPSLTTMRPCSLQPTTTPRGA